MDRKTKDRIIAVIKEFFIEGKWTEISLIGSGHINDSYLIQTDIPGNDYVLQRINHQIFKNVPGLMHNISLVTKHIENKIKSGEPLAAGLSPLIIIPDRSGGYFHLDKEGNYWRLYNYIKETRSYDQITDNRLAREGGKAFGRFQYLTADLQRDSLIETIPGFHSIEKRIEAFRNTVIKDPVNRVKEVQREIGFIEQRFEEMQTISQLIKENKIPLRVTHNDTKFNNVLFNRDKIAVCIVDLDTVMSGTILFDFGDAIRTGANTGAEDEKDLSKVNINLDLFQAYSEGYLEIARHFLTSVEIENLAFSAKFMTFLIGLRFFTDHIDGDHYYRIHFENHNLQRAKAQFKLLESMEDNFERMKEIINKVAK